MLPSVVLYLGLIVAFAGIVPVIRPIQRLGIHTRSQGAIVLAAGMMLVVIAVMLPARESRVARAESKLDAIIPVWQFDEFHSLHIAAPPEKVFAAIRAVRADEIALFRALTWIRRGGRELPESILNAGDRHPILDVATRSGFVLLADDAPREIVIGAVVAKPPGRHGKLSADVFRRQLPPGFALGIMNFRVRPDGKGGSLVSTETRVFANDAVSRRRFRVYWRLIYPGSAIIRRMWLRAIERRATA